MEEIQNTNERDVEVRGNGSQLFTESYSEQAISRLKNLVTTFFNQGDRKYYAISVDGETVVPKNCDGRKFDRYLQFVNKHTQMIEVRMYQGYSPNCNKYQFVMSRGFSGAAQQIDVKVEIEKALEEQRLQHELDALRTELAIKKKKLKKLKKLNENSESGLDKLKELVQGGVELAGALGLRKTEGFSGTPEPESEVNVEIEDQSANEKSQGSDAQNIYNDLLETYGEEKLQHALGWLNALAEYPDIQKKIKEEINNKKKDKNGQA